MAGTGNVAGPGAGTGAGPGAGTSGVDEYLRRLPADVEVIMAEVRRRLHRSIPDAGEKISYQMPTITMDGTSLVHFAAWKKHLSIYPVPPGDAAFDAAIAPYRASEGTAKFPYADPIPYDLIERMGQLFVEQRRRGG